MKPSARLQEIRKELEAKNEWLKDPYLTFQAFGKLLDELHPEPEQKALPPLLPITKPLHTLEPGAGIERK